MIGRTVMETNEQMKERGRKLYWAAKIGATSLFHPLVGEFPFIKEIDPDRWDFINTIANIWVAMEWLTKTVDIPRLEKEEIFGIVTADLGEKYPANGLRGYLDCIESMNRSMATGGISMEYALGTWIVWNLYQRDNLNDEEEKIVRIMGEMAMQSFGSYWVQDKKP